MNGGAIHANLAASVWGKAAHFLGKGVGNAAKTGCHVDDLRVDSFMEKRHECGRDDGNRSEVGVELLGVGLTECGQGVVGRFGEDASVVDKNYSCVQPCRVVRNS